MKKTVGIDKAHEDMADATAYAVYNQTFSWSRLELLQAKKQAFYNGLLLGLSLGVLGIITSLSI